MIDPNDRLQRIEDFLKLLVSTLGITKEERDTFLELLGTDFSDDLIPKKVGDILHDILKTFSFELTNEHSDAIKDVLCKHLKDFDHEEIASKMCDEFKLKPATGVRVLEFLQREYGDNEGKEIDP